MPMVPRVSPLEAHALMAQGYVYLDVRSEPEFAAGHPIGAQNVPWLCAVPSGLQPNPHFMDVVHALYPRDTCLVLGCASGQRSMHAAKQMREDGYSTLVEQRAGFSGARDPFGQCLEPGWVQAGLPVATTGGTYSELLEKVAQGRACS